MSRAKSIPASRFLGYLRCHRPTSLNEVARQVMKSAFPMFENVTLMHSIERAKQLHAFGVSIPNIRNIEEAERLIHAGVKVESRRHRRYAGGDGNLPRGCYYSVCTDESGADGGTLCREVFEYRDKRLPGVVFVGDSFDSQFASSPGFPSLGFQPGYSAVYVLLVPPADEDQLKLWVKVYSDVRTAAQMHEKISPLLAIIETVHAHHEIEDVIDLRLPETQEWFCEQFKTGELPWFSKPSGGTIRSFWEMLPSLMHPEYGGCAVTHGVGGWMRAHRIAGLVYPSARSNASATTEGNKLMGFHGWNFIDYRAAQDVKVGEGVVDGDPWPGFLLPGVELQVQALPGTQKVGWQVRGVEDGYQRLRAQLIECLSPKVAAPARPWLLVPVSFHPTEKEERFSSMLRSEIDSRNTPVFLHDAAPLGRAGVGPNSQTPESTELFELAKKTVPIFVYLDWPTDDDSGYVWDVVLENLRDVVASIDAVQLFVGDTRGSRVSYKFGEGESFELGGKSSALTLGFDPIPDSPDQINKFVKTIVDELRRVI